MVLGLSLCTHLEKPSLYIPSLSLTRQSPRATGARATAVPAETVSIATIIH